MSELFFDSGSAHVTSLPPLPETGYSRIHVDPNAGWVNPVRYSRLMRQARSLFALIGHESVYLICGVKPLSFQAALYDTHWCHTFQAFLHQS